MELYGDIETAFEVEIEDNRFTLDSTVKENLDFLGVRDATDKRPFPAFEGAHQIIGSATRDELLYNAFTIARSWNRHPLSKYFTVFHDFTECELREKIKREQRRKILWSRNSRVMRDEP